MSDPALVGVLEITLRTLKVSLSALSVAVCLGLPLGLWLGSRHFAGRRLLLSLVNAGMGAPPVVVGLLVALLLWRNHPLGSLGLMYTQGGMVLAQSIIALPLIIAISAAAIAALDETWSLQVQTLGIAGPYRLLLLLRELRTGLLSAVIAGLGSILSEVGAVMMVGGNIQGETRVLTTAILMHTQMGQFETAVGLATVLLGLMLLLSALLTLIQHRARA
ncbi:MAG: ABC transporter permease [Myxococcales bacterium]|nr:ABC transporter permease [Myxococcales bacterium]